MKKNETLLEKAKKSSKQTGIKKLITDEHIELAFGWAKNEISHAQVAEVLEIGTGSVYTFLAHAFREYVKKQK